MASDARKILLVEDEKAIRDAVAAYLEREGYWVVGVGDGQSAVEEFEKHQFDLIVLDLMLPKLSGERVCRAIRDTSDVPIIMLTAKGEVEDRIIGLELGADDYLVKPFEIVELLARVETVLRRVGKGRERIQIGDVVIDESSMQVTKGGEPVSLTKKEFDLLLLFVRNQNMALFRETIYERVWEAEYTGDSRTVDLHVQRLRKKLGWQHRLTAVYKVGYRLEVKE